MIEVYKNTDRLFLSLFSIFLLCSTALLSTHAEILKENEKTKLRGEIWYGNASWYGSKFQGKKTSNGEKFNKNKLTAAHKDLPFNTMVLVTNLKTKKSVVVRINDRGPFRANRIIDLSEEAAEEIELKKEGIAYIKLQVLTPISDNQRLSNSENNI